MFSKKDYIPFLVGLFLIGGVIFVPHMWGYLSKLKYEDSFWPSLISCAIFGFSVNSSGVLSIKRYAILLLFTMGVMIFATSTATSRSPVSFIAGGLLGCLIMTGSGWLGVIGGRWMNKNKPISDKALDKFNDMAHRLVWATLVCSLMIHTVQIRSKSQKLNFYKSILNQGKTKTYAPQISEQPNKPIQEKNVILVDPPQLIEENIPPDTMLTVYGEVYSDGSTQKRINAQVHIHDMHRIVLGNIVQFNKIDQSLDSMDAVGQIMKISPNVDPISQTTSIDIQLIDEWPQLKDGQRVKVDIH